jgi:hypothetical protein
MIDFQSFADQWKQMPETSHNSYLALNVDHPLRFEIGYHTNGHKSFAVMDAGDGISDVPSSYAIDASVRPLTNGSNVIDFQLVHNSFEDIFLELCWDMIDYSGKAKNPRRALINRYLCWQKLFQKSGNMTLSKQTQKGLLGELLYLQNEIERLGGEKAILSWAGPGGGDQDFIFEKSWSEIKTTSATSDNVTISSLEQLDQDNPGTLIVYKLEETTPGADRISLTGKVNEIRKILSDDEINLDRFEIKLLMYGYRKNDEEKYNQVQYRFISRNDYSVDERFPKLTKKDVPNEIIKCNYTLSLASLERFRG